MIFLIVISLTNVNIDLSAPIANELETFLVIQQISDSIVTYSPGRRVSSPYFDCESDYECAPDRQERSSRETGKEHMAITECEITQNLRFLSRNRERFCYKV